jgi:hypothetical protein
MSIQQQTPTDTPASVARGATVFVRTRPERLGRVVDVQGDEAVVAWPRYFGEEFTTASLAILVVKKSYRREA